MDGVKCIICGEDTEGQICPQCIEKYSMPDAELLEAFDKGTPVELDGVKYGCISALIIRKRASHLNALNGPHIIQVELMSARMQSVIIAAPKDVKVLKDWRANDADKARK